MIALTKARGEIFLFPRKRTSRPRWARHSALMPICHEFNENNYESCNLQVSSFKISK